MSPFSTIFDIGCLPKIVPALIFQLCVLSKNQRWFDISASDVISAVRKVAIKAVSFCGSSETISCASLNDCKKCLVVFQLTISKRVFSWYTKLCFVEKVAKISSCFSIIYLPRTFGHNCQNNWGVVVQNSRSIIITGTISTKISTYFLILQGLLWLCRIFGGK